MDVITEAEVTAAAAVLAERLIELRAAQGATEVANPEPDADQRVIEARKRVLEARAVVERAARTLLEDFAAELEESRRNLAAEAAALRATAPALAAAATRHSALVERARGVLFSLDLTPVAQAGGELDNSAAANGVTILGRHWQRFGATEIMAFVTLGERGFPRAGRDDPAALVAMAELLDDATDRPHAS
jgi:hypothetical protein